MNHDHQRSDDADLRTPVGREDAGEARTPVGASAEAPRIPVSTATSPLGAVDSLTIRSEAAAEVGSLLLASGMASYRVKVAMSRVARSLALDSFQSIVTFSDITATATLDGRYRTRITQPGHVGVNVDHMAAAQGYVDTIPERTSAAEVFEVLAGIRARGPLYGPILNALAAALACAAFAFLNQGGWVEMAGAFVGAGIGQFVRRRLQRRAWNHFLITIIAAIIAASLYLTVVTVPTALGWLEGDHLGGYIAAVLFVVPGFPMITGILDLVRADYAAGIARLTYAALMVSGAAASIWAVGLLAGAAGAEVPALGLDFGPMLLLRALATFVGVVGFALIFNSPWRIALIAGAVSLVANSLRFALGEAGVPAQLSTLLATVLVGLCSYVIARAWHVPRTSVSVPAVVIMIPGFTMYASYALLNAGDLTGAVLLLQQGIQVVFAAALGLALAHLATSPAWRRADQPR